MTNIQTATVENPYEIVRKPRFEAIPVYVDGERVKTREIGQYASYGAKMLGYATWKVFTFGCMALDELIEPSTN